MDRNILEIHGLVKSFSGAYERDAGEIVMNGSPAGELNPKKSQELFARAKEILDDLHLEVDPQGVAIIIFAVIVHEHRMK
jgi:hypothetical protein